ncbi:MAG: hypothetical protein M3N97_14870 [Pseudomonadota bacterium]|nr:hypothetical protein [Pseudomonadota bacterium]
MHHLKELESVAVPTATAVVIPTAVLVVEEISIFAAAPGAGPVLLAFPDLLTQEVIGYPELVQNGRPAFADLGVYIRCLQESLIV